MKLTGIQIEGFGVWRDLELPDLGSGMTAFYGPNEAGKTTVLQFIRSMLYGPSAQRRARYLPPVSGGKPGGCLAVEGPLEHLQICRTFDRNSAAGDRLQIRTQSGEPRGVDELAALLGGVDEPTFNNVYAVGLRELQELGTLSDTEAATWLYSLTTGVDRVSLLDVMQHLEQSREALLARDGSGGAIKSLLAQRDKLAAQIDQRQAHLGQWSALHVRLDQLAGEIRELHDRHVHIAREARTLEIAVQLEPRWRERQDLERQLAPLAGRLRLPDNALQTLEELNQQIAAHDRDAEVLKRQREALREEADSLGINEVLVRNASRVQALGEQKDWLEALERQAAAIGAELNEIQSQLATEHERLGAEFKSAANKRTPEISEGMLNSLRPHAKALKVCKEHLLTAQREADHKREAYEEYEAQLQVAMPPASEGMPTDLEEAGELVTALRRRLQVEQKLQQARRNEIDLQQQQHELLDRQELPLWMEASHTVLVILGVALFAIGLLIGANGAAWVGGVMLVLLVALRIFKYVGEEQVSARREGLQRQLELVQKQVQEAHREQEELHRQLGPLEGSVVVKLQAAERHLQELEKLLPIDSKRRDAKREAESAARRAEEAARKLEGAEATWRGRLAALGLPNDWTPSDLRAMAGRYEQISELSVRVARRREDAQQRQREHAMLCERIRHLAEEVGLDEPDADAPALLVHLLSELRGQETKVAERSRLRRRARELKGTQVRHVRKAAALRQRRDSIFLQAGCEDEAAYRELFQEQQHADNLRRKRDALGREITAAIGGHASEETFGKLLESESVAAIESRWEATSTELEENDAEMHQLVEQRGAIGQQLDELAKDTSLAERQLELAAVEAELAEAVEAWRVHAATCTVLERIRVYYEKHRQPETLIEASRLFASFTGGRYRRVWTPLGKSLLFADTRDGQSLPADVLSRGTREQLFLALRLALVSLLARRGVKLPIILDDVLVNFDARRASRAAEALQVFAEAGHQVLVFTCHEHIAATLAELGVDVRQLPNRFGDEDQDCLPPAKRTRRSEPQPVVVIEVEGEEDEAGEADDAPELELEPPEEPALQPTYAIHDEDEYDEGQVYEEYEEYDVDDADETDDEEDEYELVDWEDEATEEDETEPLELAGDEDEPLKVEEPAEALRPVRKRRERKVVPFVPRNDLDDWIRIGPQVRRREIVEVGPDAEDVEDAFHDDEYEDDPDDDVYDEEEYELLDDVEIDSDQDDLEAA